MIAKVWRRGNLRALMRDLVRRDASGELYSGVRIVGGDDAVLGMFEGLPLDMELAYAITRFIETPLQLIGGAVTVPRYAVDAGGKKVVDPETGKPVIVGRKDASVWHVVLSLSPDDAWRSDGQWRQMCAEFMEQMEFAETGDHAAARWVAIRRDDNDINDLVHIAATLVRDDGTAVNLRNDYYRVATITTALERTHGLVAVPRGRSAAHASQSADASGKGIR